MTENNYSLGLRVGDIEIIAEGDEKFVKNSFWKLYKKTGLVDRKSCVKSSNAEEKNLIDEYKNMSLAEFVNLKQPQGNRERVVVFGYWLQIVQKQESFSNSELKACYKDLVSPKPSNLAQDLKFVRSKGRIRSLGRGSWTLTDSGKEFVEELPRSKEK